MFKLGNCVDNNFKSLEGTFQFANIDLKRCISHYFMRLCVIAWDSSLHDA